MKRCQPSKRIATHHKNAISAEFYDNLKSELLDIESKFELSKQIENDPLSRVLEFNDPKDRELVAFIASAFAYGNVKQILKTVDTILKIIGPSPYITIKNSDGTYWQKNIPKYFKHRFNTAQDLGLLLTWLGQALQKSNTLENFFFENYNNQNVDELLEDFISRITTFPTKPYQMPKSKGVLWFFCRPSQKSGCKRLMLFLKWMSGSGPMALNQWKKLDRAKLIIPVDTHVLRISQNLKLTKRKDTSWKTATEITEKLKNMDPQDPTRFDFALCHLGISQACPSRFKISVCENCQMNKLCFRYKR